MHNQCQCRVNIVFFQHCHIADQKAKIKIVLKLIKTKMDITLDTVDEKHRYRLGLDTNIKALKLHSTRINHKWTLDHPLTACLYVVGWSYKIIHRPFINLWHWPYLVKQPMEHPYMTSWVFNYASLASRMAFTSIKHNNAQCLWMY